MPDNTVKFGRKQLKNPTPANVGATINVITVIVGIVIGWLGTVTWIPAPYLGPTLSILGLILAILNGIKPFFGVEILSKTVSTDNVTAIETNEITDTNNNNNTLKKTT